MVATTSRVYIYIEILPHGPSDDDDNSTSGLWRILWVIGMLKFEELLESKTYLKRVAFWENLDLGLKWLTIHSSQLTTKKSQHQFDYLCSNHFLLTILGTFSSTIIPRDELHHRSNLGLASWVILILQVSDNFSKKNMLLNPKSKLLS